MTATVFSSTTNEPLISQPLLPDVSVQIMYFIFTANLLFCTFAITVGAIPYYHYFGYLSTRNIFVASLSLVGVSYVAMSVCIVLKHVDIALWCLFFFWTLCGVFVGFISAFTYNIAPIQFMTIWWAQSVTIVAYTRYSPQRININTATIWMGAVSAVVWCVSIYGFIVESDWIPGVIILFLSVLLVLYNRLHLQRVVGRYNMSWEDGVTAICSYYCFDMVRLLKCGNGQS